ncbi:MAG: hypothetical protein ACLFPF_05840 [Halanaerobiales bacterium]
METYTDAEPYRMEFGDKLVLKKEEADELLKFLVKEYFRKK